MTDLNKPLPAHLQQEFEQLIRQRFDGQAQAFSSALSVPPLSDAPREEASDWEFHLKPREIKEYLDRYVIRQNEAKKTLAIALCDHYNQVSWRGPGEDEDYQKQNILLLGPTGVGKTYLIRKMAGLIGVPFVKADATKFSETGYVGAKVEDLLCDLVLQAKGDLGRAACGIVYLDEADKLARRSRDGGKDVNTQGVQFGLLRLLEETDIDLRSVTEFHPQLAPVLDLYRGQSGRLTLNTKHILFILSGAFHGLEEIIYRRLHAGAIGFTHHQNERPTDQEILNHATAADFISYGLEPEFIGRLPVRVACHPLNEADYFQILTASEGSVLKQYQRSFAVYDIDLSFTNGALRMLAAQAAAAGTGARALLSLCERALRPFKFDLPSTPLHELKVTEELLRDPDLYLLKILQAHGLQPSKS